MAIGKIDAGLCSGCGKCEICCPADVIRMNKETRKACVQYPEDCVMCFWCLSECPQDAISMSAGKASPLFTSWG